MAVAQVAGRAPAKGSGDAHAPAQVMANPFTRAARRKTEKFLDVAAVLGTSALTLAQVDVPATGYLRHLVLTVTADSNTGATFTPDAPFNVIQSITFKDVNGQPLHVLSGYDLFLANLFGGYVQNADPRKAPDYNATATGVSFTVRIPLEIIGRGALGALANLNASMTYKLAIALAPKADVFATNAPTTGNVRITGVVESWSNPSPQDVRGVPNQTRPPAEGTTQNWSENVAPIVSGQNTIRLPRVGNSIRNIILVNRDGSGARTATGMPTELAVFLDGNQWHRAPLSYFTRRVWELYGYAGADIPAGVVVMPFTDDFDGTPGEEVGDFWVQTSGATRLEIQGTWSAAGSLTVLTNDVLAIAGPSGAGATLGAQS